MSLDFLLRFRRVEGETRNLAGTGGLLGGIRWRGSIRLGGLLRVLVALLPGMGLARVLRANFRRIFGPSAGWSPIMPKTAFLAEFAIIIDMTGSAKVCVLTFAVLT